MALLIRRLAWVGVTCVFLLAASNREAAAQDDLWHLSLEDLMNVEVTTASRKEQVLARTAAAVYVITTDDIRWSGARTIPDLLRLVPGFNVAQVDATTWAVSARGFNGVYANKLLVLVDGRSVYTPVYAGVHWGMLGLPLDEVERIEVVRGPGGSLWGINAVNGVVNIITKSAGETPGWLARVDAGGVQRGIGLLRYGGGFGDSGRYRVYGRYAVPGADRIVSGLADADNARTGMAGMRADWQRGIDRVTVTGSVQRARNDHARAQALTAPPFAGISRFEERFTEGNVGAEWTRTPSGGRETQVRGTYAAHAWDARYPSPSRPFVEQWRNLEVEGRHRRAIGPRHELVAGAAYRYWMTAFDNSAEIAFAPTSQRQQVVTAFAQHEVDLGAGVRLTSGLKAEPNRFTGLELQPSLRLLWNPRRVHSLWASAGRAVRIPSMVERSARIWAFAAPGPDGVPFVGVLEGSASADSEVLYAYEAGYRAQLGRLFVDATVFTNQYDTLLDLRVDPLREDRLDGRPALVLPLRFGNTQGGRTHGTEVAASAVVAPWWRASGSWSYLDFDPYAPLPAFDLARLVAAPRHVVHVRSYVDLTHRAQVAVMAWRVGAVGAVMPGWTTATVRVSSSLGRTVEVGLGVENLFHAGDIEFPAFTGFIATPARTSMIGDVSWRF